MQQGRPSRTALSVGMHRAAHQKLEQGTTFADPFALPIIGREARRRLDDWAASPQRRLMRLFVAARHRVADERLAAAAAARGVRQAVIVGAGLDTTALRGVEGAPDMAFFEVDHPATQAWKRAQLQEEDLAVPEALIFVAVDFERQSFSEELARAGFDSRRPAFFIWLGVVPYLTEAAIFGTLGFIAGVPGAELVFDYANPPDQLGATQRERFDRRAAAVAALGEPWLSYFDTPTLHARLRALGAGDIEDLGPGGIARYVYGIAEPAYDGPGGHILWARWPASRG